MARPRDLLMDGTHANDLPRRTGDGRHDAARALSLLHEYPLALFVSANAKEREHDDTGARIDRERLRQLASDSEDPATRRSARALLDGHE